MYRDLNLFRNVSLLSLAADFMLVVDCRKSSHPLTFKISLKLFLLALLGYVLDLHKLLLVSVSINPACNVDLLHFRITWSLNMYNIGLKYTSASVASAATNSIPVFTFFLAVLLRFVTLLPTLSAYRKTILELKGDSSIFSRQEEDQISLC